MNGCRLCGCETNALTGGGWCVTCDRLISFETVRGLRDLACYLAKVARFEAYLAEHGVSA